MIRHVSAAHQALALATAGRSPEAVTLLRASTDPEARLLLALWHVEGRHLPRDFAAARRLLVDAAARGHAGATRLLAGFLAAGRGGPRDWPGALRLLDDDPRQRDLLAAMDLDAAGDPRTLPTPERLHDAPRIERLPALLSPAECAFLADAARARLKRATIYHEGRGRFVEDPLRSSDAAAYGAIFEGPAIHALNRRLAAASGTDVGRGETLQLLRYRPGQEYRPHHDAVAGLANQRVLTLIVYLNEGYAGGETIFPAAGVSVRGRIGDGLLFANTDAAGRPDPAAIHAGLPVTAGEKLIASRWIRARPPASAEAGFGRHEIAG